MGGAPKLLRKKKNEGSALRGCSNSPTLVSPTTNRDLNTPQPDMKKNHALLTAALLLCSLATTQPNSAQAGISIGNGSATSHVVIEGFSGGPLIYDVFYDYNPFDAPDSFDLLSLIDVSDDNLGLTWINYGTVDEPNYFLDAIQYGNQTFTNTGAPTFSPFWSQWVSDGKAGFPTAFDIPGGSWTFGSGFSAPYRFHEPGSWDGLIYNDGSTSPSTQPIPEPAGVLLLGAGWLVRLLRRRPPVA